MGEESGLGLRSQTLNTHIKAAFSMAAHKYLDFTTLADFQGDHLGCRLKLDLI